LFFSLSIPSKSSSIFVFWGVIERPSIYSKYPYLL
jgi:hypothetical protein